jgi:acetylornithine/succinyldiaminopimelate/putrescine aminotransferase
MAGAQQGRVQLVQAENLIREAGVRIQNGEQHLRQVEQQRTQAQQQLQRMQQGAQAQMAARGRGRGMMRGGW